MNEQVQALAAISEQFEDYLRPYVKQLVEQGILTDDDFKPLPEAPSAETKEKPEPKTQEYAQSFPGGLTTDFLLDPRTQRIIHSKAFDLVSTGVFQPYEEDDLCQDILLGLWARMPQYDPTVPNTDPYKYAGTVVANFGKNLLSRRWYEINNGRPTVSLSEMANEEDTLGDLIGEDEGGPLCGCGMPSAKRMMMQEAVSSFLSALTGKPLAICVLLLLGFSKREIARKISYNEKMVRKIITSELRPAAIAAGLDDFAGGAQ